jgi:hypothetical protein
LFLSKEYYDFFPDVSYTIYPPFLCSGTVWFAKHCASWWAKDLASAYLPASPSQNLEFGRALMMMADNRKTTLSHIPTGLMRRKLMLKRSRSLIIFRLV